MGADQNQDWQALAASALDWWRDAGVDALVGETPLDWLAPVAPVAPTGLPMRPVAAAPATAAMPAELDAFLAWRMGPDAPEAGWTGRRLGPEGAVATTIVVTDLPDRDDLSAGRLLSGSAGTLFGRMLTAIGLSREGVHLVPVATARPLAGRIATADEARFAEVIRHHLTLAQPERVLLLGDAASRAVLGMTCVAARGSSHAINHGGGRARVIASLHPRYLLDRPAAKGDAWRDLLLLMGTDEMRTGER